MELKYGFLAGVLVLGLSPVANCSEGLSFETIDRMTLPKLGKTQFVTEQPGELPEATRSAPARFRASDDEGDIEHEVRMIGGESFNLALLTQAKAVAEEKPATEVRTETSEPARPKTLRRRVLVFKASWCGACQALNYEWPRLRAVNWRVGTDDTQHFQMVDADERPDLLAKYGVASLPTILVVEDEKEVSRHGLLSAPSLAELYYGRLR